MSWQGKWQLIYGDKARLQPRRRVELGRKDGCLSIPCSRIKWRISWWYMNNRMDWWAILYVLTKNSTIKCAYSVDHFPTNVHFDLTDSWWISEVRRRCVALGADVTQPPIKVSTWHVIYCLLFLVAQPLDRLSFVNLALFFYTSVWVSQLIFFFVFFNHRK